MGKGPVMYRKEVGIWTRIFQTMAHHTFDEIISCHCYTTFSSSLMKRQLSKALASKATVYPSGKFGSRTGKH